MAKSSGFHIGTITGKEEVLAALAKLEPELYDELVRQMKGEADSIAQDIDGAMPGDAPMSGFDNHGGRTAWGRRGSAYTKESKQALGDSGAEWPVYKVGLGGYASSVGDIAGAGGTGNSASGANMITVLNSRNGKASRWVWPVGNRHKPKIEAKMEDACKKIEAALSKKVAR